MPVPAPGAAPAEEKAAGALSKEENKDGARFCYSRPTHDL